MEATKPAVRVVAWLCLLVAAFIASVAMTPAAEPEPEGEPAPSKFRSPDDGWFDIGGFLDRAYGFVPLLIPITEPAVGYGAVGAVVFIDKPPAGTQQPGLGRPNLTAVGGFATDNGTSGFLAGDVRHWRDDRVQTVVGGIDASINLDFYGVGDNPALEDDPVTYTLEPLAGAVRARYRFGDSRIWGGLSYALADTVIAYDDDSTAAALLGLPDRSRVGGLTPSLAYDSRDNFFTPTRGSYFEGTAGLFDEALGGDTSFQRVGLTWIHYAPVHPKVTLGVKGSATFAFGDTPFYMLPFVTLRGAPVLRYQGEEAADVETEVRWQCWGRFSAVGFVGAGAAWNDFERLDDVTEVVTGGTGFRYELARRYGMHAGVDVAFGPDGTVFYFQFGSAWARP